MRKGFIENDWTAGEDLGSRNCPLCRLFINKRCEGCPVSKASGKVSCFGTPYERYSTAKWTDQPERVLEMAKLELKFLRLLHPQKSL